MIVHVLGLLTPTSLIPVKSLPPGFGMPRYLVAASKYEGFSSLSLSLVIAASVPFKYIK